MLAIFVPAPGSPTGYVPNVVDFVGSLIDTPLVAIIAAYLASLLANYARSRQREQDNVRRQRALVRVGETLIRGVGDQPGSIQHLLQEGVSQLRQGGHFQRLFMALAETSSDDDTSPRLLTCIESDVLRDTQELMMDVAENELLMAVRAVASGQSLPSPNATKQAITRMMTLASGKSHITGEELTEREGEVLALIARGYTNKQIAEALYMSEKTARNHVSHILEKLGLSRCSEAAAFVVENKLVPPRERDNL